MRVFQSRRILCALLALTMVFGALCAASGEVVITISDGSGSSSVMQNAEYLDSGKANPTQPPPPADPPAGEAAAPDAEGQPDPSVTLSGGGEVPAGDGEAAPAGGDPDARAAFIDGILALAEKLYDEANGRAQRAQYSGDIYVCKNYTVYLFRQTAEKFRMAAYPDQELVIPDNLPKKECKVYVYGAEWKAVEASAGNPFIVAAQFRYDEQLSKDENRAAARAFLQQAQRGDYFQMAANYYYGVGAHSMVFTADYDPDTDTVHWTDSNMKGEKRNGVRYGYVQYDAEKKIDWFVDAFCRKKYGATLYRLRDDIIFAE